MRETIMRAATPHELAGRSTPNVVVVDPAFAAYRQLTEDARSGRVGLHFRSAGQDALRLARRFHVDAWVVAAELDDMSGEDFVQLLESRHGDARVALASNGGDVNAAAPISLEDLSDLLELPVEKRRQDRRVQMLGDAAVQSFVRLPISVGAAVVVFAVLALG